MTKAEFASIAAAMRTYYPREPLFPNEHAIELWFKQLREFSAAAMQHALEFWVKRNKFSPSIAELSQLTKDVQDGRIINWNELVENRRTRKITYKPTENLIDKIAGDAAAAEMQEAYREALKERGLSNDETNP